MAFTEKSVTSLTYVDSFRYLREGEGEGKEGEREREEAGEREGEGRRDSCNCCIQTIARY